MPGGTGCRRAAGTVCVSRIDRFPYTWSPTENDSTAPPTAVTSPTVTVPSAIGKRGLMPCAACVPVRRCSFSSASNGCVASIVSAR